MSVLEGGRPPKRPRLDVKPQADDPSRFGKLLSDAEIEAVRQKARLTVERELKDRQEKALLAQFIAEERLAHDPAKEEFPIFLHLPVHMPFIMLDGKQFLHEVTYWVTADVAAVLIEQMNRGWAHEEVTEVRDATTRRRYRAPSDIGYGNFTGERRGRNLQISSGVLQGTSAGTLLGIGDQ